MNQKSENSARGLRLEEGQVYQTAINRYPGSEEYYEPPPADCKLQVFRNGKFHDPTDEEVKAYYEELKDMPF